MFVSGVAWWFGEEYCFVSFEKICRCVRSFGSALVIWQSAHLHNSRNSKALGVDIEVCLEVKKGREVA